MLMEIDLGFLEDNEVHVKSGIEYTGGKEKYLSALKRYYQNYEDNREKLEKLWADRDMENYMIQVHALKSNSRMVGANALAEAFEAHETAAGEGNSSFIDENSMMTIEEYSQFVELIKPIGEADIEKPADEISGEEAIELSKELLDTLDEYDDEKSLELAKKLCGYPFRPRQREQMNQAIKLITEFRYDDAADIVREITGSIE
jgi:HPt (histidine-containing phosphotransfer) domain-containing protein